MARTEQYLPDGKKRTVSRAQIVAAWPWDDVPANYALGTGKHETNYAVNELDTEESGLQTSSIFQFTDAELARAGSSRRKVLAYTDEEKIPALEESARVLHILALANRDAILKATGLSIDDAAPDLWAYMAIAHNQGLGRYATADERKKGEHPGALGSIADYGMDWDAYKKRNPNIKGIASYGDDVISGGGFFDDKKKVLEVGGLVVLGLGVAGLLAWWALADEESAAKVAA